MTDKRNYSGSGGADPCKCRKMKKKNIIRLDSHEKSDACSGSA